jgi:hypothetical protein
MGFGRFLRMQDLQKGAVGLRLVGEAVADLRNIVDSCIVYVLVVLVVLLVV